MCLIRSPATSNANTVTVTPFLLSHQTGLAVDGAFHERRVARCPVGDFDPGARDLLAAFDRAQEGYGETAAVCDRRGVGVEQADQGVDVLGFPCLLEGPDDLGLPGGRARGGLRGADATPGRGGQLAACRRGTADDLGHLGEGVAEDVVQDERDALSRGHRVEHDQESHVDRLVQGDPVGGVGQDGPAWPADPLGPFWQRLGDPFAHVGLSPGPGRAEQIEADAAGDRGEPGAGGFDGVLLPPGQGVPAGVGLLHGVLGLGQGAKEPVGEVDQLTPLAHDRVQARIGQAPARISSVWPGWGGHGAGSFGRICPHPFDKTAHRNVRLARRLTFRGVVLSDF